jgi:hypothetical protein
MLQYLNQFIVVQQDLVFCPKKSYYHPIYKEIGCYNKIFKDEKRDLIEQL